MADSLYASEPVFKCIKNNGWHFLIRYKDGSIPSVAEEYRSICGYGGSDSLDGTTAREYPRRGKVNKKLHMEWVPELDYRGYSLTLLALEKCFSFTGPKTGRVLAVYHAGLNLAAVMLVVRGVTQALAFELSSGMSAAVSGVAGIGHILLGVSMVLLLVQVKRTVTAERV